MVECNKKVCNTRKNQQFCRSDSDNGEPLKPEDAAEKINKYFVSLSRVCKFAANLVFAINLHVCKT